MLSLFLTNNEKEGTISFSRNGESNGVAFEHIAIKKDEIDWFSPLILLNRNARVRFRFQLFIKLFCVIVCELSFF
jgi:hypothetical protein